MRRPRSVITAGTPSTLITSSRPLSPASGRPSSWWRSMRAMGCSKLRSITLRPHHPPAAVRRKRPVRRGATSRAEVEDPLARRHHVNGDVLAGLYSVSGWRRRSLNSGCTVGRALRGAESLRSDTSIGSIAALDGSRRARSALKRPSAGQALTHHSVLRTPDRRLARDVTRSDGATTSRSSPPPIEAQENSFGGIGGINRVSGPAWASSSAGRPSRLAPASPRRSRSSFCGRLRSSC